MSQIAKDSGSQRKLVGAFVDADQRRQLVELARQEDRSVSAIVRRALAAELERKHETA
jgi:hypothetical protein